MACSRSSWSGRTSRARRWEMGLPSRTASPTRSTISSSSWRVPSGASNSIPRRQAYPGRLCSMGNHQEYSLHLKALRGCPAHQEPGIHRKDRLLHVGTGHGHGHSMRRKRKSLKPLFIFHCSDSSRLLQMPCRIKHCQRERSSECFERSRQSSGKRRWKAYGKRLRP